jgi:hypothetical protein
MGEMPDTLGFAVLGTYKGQFFLLYSVWDRAGEADLAPGSAADPGRVVLERRSLSPVPWSRYLPFSLKGMNTTLFTA